MTRAETRKILAWFQSSVGLSDWEIEISVTKQPPEGLMDDAPVDDWIGFLGRGQSHVPLHRAKIWINPEAHKPSTDLFYDRTGEMQETLFHELLHVFFADTGLEETGPQCEHAINQLAAVLMKQYQN